jgi:hypothetical protein
MKIQYTPIAVVPRPLANLIKDHPVLREYEYKAGKTVDQEGTFFDCLVFTLTGTVPAGAAAAYFADAVLPVFEPRAFLYRDNEGFIWVVCRDDKGEPCFLLQGLQDPYDGDRQIRVDNLVTKWRSFFPEEVF